MAARCRQAQLCHRAALVLTNSAGNAVFDTHGNTLTLAGSLSGPGGLVKTGSGTLLLTAANRYSGPTAITLGTLEAGSTGSLPGLFGSPSRVSVAKGASLALSVGGTGQWTSAAIDSLLSTPGVFAPAQSCAGYERRGLRLRIEYRDARSGTRQNRPEHADLVRQQYLCGRDDRQ